MLKPDKQFIRFAAMSFGCGAVMLASCEKTSSTPQSQEVSWVSTSVDQLDEKAAAQLALAIQARNEMESTLKSNLLASIKADGPHGAVGVCSVIAPKIATELSEKHGVTIGRTSFKLRNQTNTPPAWMKSIVDTKQAESAYFINADGTLAVTYPINIAPPCMLCHGDKNIISANVRSSIAENYPADQATGFALGDLRGWFWVEVPVQ